MARSLLAHLYPHIRGSQEDVATLSLAYLLSNSDPLRVAFTRILSLKLHINLDDKMQYHTQASGENKERPDLAGMDSSGKENVLCEMKFYAALTGNQPNAYLDRLIAVGGKGLVFICPHARQIGLWQQLLVLCKDRSVMPLDDTTAVIDNMPMAIMSWLEVLDVFQQVASEKDPGILDDLHQLRGFCERMDAIAAVPFRPEDFGIDVAKGIDRYADTVDATLSHFLRHKEYNPTTKGARATPLKYGYARYLNITNYAIDLRYDRNLWKDPSSVETPFWVAFTGYHFDHSRKDEIRGLFSVVPDMYKAFTWWGTYLALIPKPYVTLDEVAADLCDQIIAYLDFLKLK